jgi:hypothetical protein
MFLTYETRKLLCLSSVAVGLLGLCSCATRNARGPQLPAGVTMNREAGRGGLLLLTCRMADGEKLPLVLDTGSPITVLDKSLEPKLGKCIDVGTLRNFGATQEVGLYAAPQLYLGRVPLRMAGTNVVTFDRQKLADRSWFAFMGFLGMDVLKNYCLQLDFAAGKIRFLNSTEANKTNWGRPFPLTDCGDGCPAVSENLAGVKGLGSVIDTGCDCSGWLHPEILQQWTNQASSGKVHPPNGILGGEIYRDLDLRRLDAKSLSTNDMHTALNGIGLRLLSENLVTLDFPNRVMYLKRTSKWPLVDKHEMAIARSMANSAVKFLIRLKRRNQLPGLSKKAHGQTTDFHFDHYDSPYLDSVTWYLQKDGNPDIYHYTVTRTSRHGSWKLKKAWRTDAHDNVLEEYPIP